MDERLEKTFIVKPSEDLKNSDIMPSLNLNKDEKIGKNDIMSAEFSKNKENKLPKDKLNISVDLNEKHFFKDLRAKAKNVLEKLKNTDITNKNNGVIARISRDGIDKMMSVDAVNKSLKKNYSKEEHFASVENVDKLFQNATFTNSEKPRNQSADIVAYHKYNAPFTINGNKKANAKITLKESVVAGNRIYSLELLEIG